MKKESRFCKKQTKIYNLHKKSDFFIASKVIMMYIYRAKTIKFKGIYCYG